MRKLYEDIVCIPSVEGKLQSLLNDKSDLHKKVEDLQSALKAENADVENLSKQSLSNFFYHIIGKMDEKIIKEKAEACEMALKYQSAVAQLESVSQEVADYKAQLAVLNESETRYKILFEVKSDAIEKSESVDGIRLTKIEKQQIHSRQNIREIDQAIHEGECSLDITNAILEKLHSAHSWGVYDLFLNGGLLSFMVKHDRINEAEELLNSLQKQLGKFKTELADVSIASEFTIAIGGGWGFADFLLDGFLVDFFVLKKIDAAIENVRKLKNDILSVIEKLKQLSEETKAELENIKAEKNTIVKSHMT